MERGYVFRLYPTRHQAKALVRMCNIARALNNKVTFATYKDIDARVEQACEQYAEKQGLDALAILEQYRDKEIGRPQLKNDGFSLSRSAFKGYADLYKHEKEQGGFVGVLPGSMANFECGNVRQTFQNWARGKLRPSKNGQPGKPQYRHKTDKLRIGFQIKDTTSIDGRYVRVPNFNMVVGVEPDNRNDLVRSLKWIRAAEDISKRIQGRAVSAVITQRLKSNPIASKEHYRAYPKGGRAPLQDVGVWELSLTCVDIPLLQQPEEHIDNAVVGVDLNTGKHGIVATTNIGEWFHWLLPESLNKLYRRIEFLQKKCQRRQAPDRKMKQRASQGWKKAQRQIAKLHLRITNIRCDWLHKITTFLTKRYGTLVIEDLQVKNMTTSAKGTAEQPGKNVRAKAGLNRSILRSAFATFRQQIDYKSKQWGCKLVVADQWLPTSQTCSECGQRPKKNIGLNKRIYVCKHCGVVMDRDVNAANNLVLFEADCWYKNSKGQWCSKGNKGALPLSAGGKDRHISDELVESNKKPEWLINPEQEQKARKTDNVSRLVAHASGPGGNHC